MVIVLGVGRRAARTASAAALCAALLGGCGGAPVLRGDDGGSTGGGDRGSAAPSGTPAASTGASAGPAGSLLERLRVAAPGTMDGYSRDRFPHWSHQHGACDTREVVLRRDGKHVHTDDECHPVSGTWRSPYDGAVWHDSADVDIDHVVPLADAWRSGARSWSDARREAFANDLDRPQLVAVTDNVNESKGDATPDQWKPPLKSDWCAYARDWVTVKHYYHLTVTAPEKHALAAMLHRCPG
jgi:uncharacterized protein DUF1524